MRIFAPMGLLPSKSSRRTVSPITHTAPPERRSADVKKRPSARTHLLIAKYTGVVPMTGVVRAVCR